MFSDISAKAQENFSGARLIRAYVQEQAEIESFERENTEYIARSLKLVRLMGMLWPTLETLLGLAVVIVLWVGGREVLLHRISVGSFVGFQYLHGAAHLADHFAGMGHQHVPARYCVHGAHSKHSGRAAGDHRCRRSLKWRSHRGSRRNRVSQSQLPLWPTLIAAERGMGHVHGDEAVLKNINLRVPEGTSLAIVGPTGSGKSTLVSLIPRIYDAAEGSVLIDGRPIREIPSGGVAPTTLDSSRRRRFCSATPFARTSPSAAEDATDDDVRRAAEAANIAEEIESFPDGYNTLVGERGLTLSGGQKQRTAIARAVIRNPRILVLDDALASVDTQTEDRILNHLREIMQGRTTIFISHRVSTVRNADRIAVLHDGQHRRVRHPRRARSSATATTPSCTTNSCWKKSWRRKRCRGDILEEFMCDRRSSPWAPSKITPGESKLALKGSFDSLRSLRMTDEESL